MIGRYLTADQRRNGKVGVVLAAPLTPVFASNLARIISPTVAILYAVGMAMLLALICLQIRASRLRDEKMNG